MEFLSIWGTSDENVGFTGDTYQFNGLYPWILKDGPTTNVFDLAAKISLSDLDNALDATQKKYQYLSGGQWVWFMSPKMISTVSALQTLVRRQVQQLEFEGGFVMDTYNGVPILPSGYVEPASTTASVTSLAASGGGSGSVPDGIYRYKVAAITLFGEQVASASASATLTSNAACALAWTANANAKSYAVYRTAVGEADTAGLYDLLDIIPAKNYDANGAVTTNVSTYIDDFTKTKIEAAHPLFTYDSASKPEEVIFLAYLDPVYGAALAVLPPTLGDPLEGDPTRNLVRFVPISVTDDTYAFRLKSYLAMQIADAAVAGAVIRRVRRNTS